MKYLSLVLLLILLAFSYVGIKETMTNDLAAGITYIILLFTTIFTAHGSKNN